VTGAPTIAVESADDGVEEGGAEEEARMPGAEFEVMRSVRKAAATADRHRRVVGYRFKSSLSRGPRRGPRPVSRRPSDGPAVPGISRRSSSGQFEA
jgi:hypothetical protein